MSGLIHNSCIVSEGDSQYGPISASGVRIQEAFWKMRSSTPGVSGVTSRGDRWLVLATLEAHSEVLLSPPGAPPLGVGVAPAVVALSARFASIKSLLLAKRICKLHLIFCLYMLTFFGCHVRL